MSNILQTFIEHNNTKLLWDLLSDEPPLNALSIEDAKKFNQHFKSELQLFFNTHANNSKPPTNLMLLNRLFLSNFITASAPSTTPYKASDIQADRINKFETEFSHKKLEFDNAITLKKPPIPNFEDSLDSEKINNMDELIAQQLAQRNLDTSHLDNLYNKNSSKWLSSSETSIRTENTSNNNNAIKYIKIERDNLPQTKNIVIDINEIEDNKKQISWSNNEYYTPPSPQLNNLFSKLKVKEPLKIEELKEQLDRIEKLLLTLVEKPAN